MDSTFLSSRAVLKEAAAGIRRCPRSSELVQVARMYKDTQDKCQMSDVTLVKYIAYVV